MRDAWALDDSIHFLNHGSYGATPKAVLAKQQELRAQLESEPVRFMSRELEPLLDAARAAGVMPLIRLAWPRFSGLKRVSFSQASNESPGIPL